MTQVILIVELICLLVIVAYGVRYLRRITRLAKATHEATNEVVSGLKKRAFYEMPVVREHLTALADIGTAQNHPPARVSFGLSSFADRLTPKLTRQSDGHTVICTIAVGDTYRSIVKPCLDSQSDFAARHGFDHCVLEDLPIPFVRPIPWIKIPLFIWLLSQGYQRILFIDADAMVTNPNVSVDPFFAQLEAQQRPLLIAEDEESINFGVVWIVKSDATLRLLDLIWLNDSDVNHPLWEQNALRLLMSESSVIQSIVAIQPNPKLFNSFPSERQRVHFTRPNQIWSPGDFICHFSGMRGDYLSRSIHDYAEALKQQPSSTAVSRD